MHRVYGMGYNDNRWAGNRCNAQNGGESREEADRTDWLEVLGFGGEQAPNHRCHGCNAGAQATWHGSGSGASLWCFEFGSMASMKMDGDHGRGEEVLSSLLSCKSTVDLESRLMKGFTSLDVLLSFTTDV